MTYDPQVDDYVIWKRPNGDWEEGWVYFKGDPVDNEKRINYFLIDNGFNSSNEYIARWLWYCKNILPKFLGGFDKVTNVKKI